MRWKERTLDQIADLICGAFPAETTFFPYRSSSYLTRFFRDADTDYVHDGSTRATWVSATLRSILEEPQINTLSPPDSFCRVIKTLMDRSDATHESSDRIGAMNLLNLAIAREGFEASYAEDGNCYLRHLATNSIAIGNMNPHRPFSKAELERKNELLTYLDQASEDDLTFKVLLPMFRQLGFSRVTASGHNDKALEYGKDVWMKHILPTQHVIYFGVQVKKGKLDSAGTSKSQNTNIAEIHNQVSMMLGHEIFDSELNRRVLVDHAFIIAGGEITKAARNWLGNKLDHAKRSQILFMDREDILNLFIVSKLDIPENLKLEKDILSDEVPF